MNNNSSYALQSSQGHSLVINPVAMSINSSPRSSFQSFIEQPSIYRPLPSQSLPIHFPSPLFPVPKGILRQNPVPQTSKII